MSGKQQAMQGGVVVPHPPLILPNIGKGEEKKIEDITTAYQLAMDTVKNMDADTIVIVTPHAPSYMDYIQLTAPAVSKGDMAQFNDPMDRFVIRNDVELVKEMERLAKAANFPMGTLGKQDGGLDHATMVPLYFMKDFANDKKIVRMSIGGLSNFDHYKAGKILEQAAQNLGRRIAVVSSSDLSHCQKPGPGYGYKECGPKYDAKFMELISEGNFKDLVEMPEKVAEEAMVCGHKPMCVLAGALDGLQPEIDALAHSAVFGVGYGIATFTNPKPAESRKFEQQIQDDLDQALRDRLAKEDDYIRLARDTVNSFVLEGKLPSKPDNLPKEMTDQQAGVFVSLHENGQLRGCIGTTTPTTPSIADEIRQNAISACSRDPRFYPVQPDELNQLEISVDVLKEPEPCTFDDLDVKKYGVIVTKGNKRGLLLPNLDGVDTPEQQVAIAKQKAGLKETEPGCSLERFEVIRHEV